MRRLYLAIAILLLLPSTTEAMPGMGSSGSQNPPQSQEERFKAMDKNNDGSVSHEEFFGRFPSMHDAAFKSIDKDGNGSLTLEEWLNFSSSHSREKNASGMGAGMGSMGGGPVMREMFKEDGNSAPAAPKGRPLFEMKQKDGAE